MRVAVSGLTALRALRVYRRSRAPLPTERAVAPRPDPSPRRRWSAGIVPLERLALDAPPTADHPLEVVVARPRDRSQARFFETRVHPSRLPAESFVDLGGGLFMPCPELLFLQLSRVMPPEVLSLLGYELCGTYSRDPQDPREGPVVYDVPPVTSVARIASYLARCGEHAGVLESRHALSHVRDNSWSPMESIIALLAVRGVHELGYGLGDVVLNVRHGATPELVALGARGSRVPDIEVVGTHVGFNYDGASHLDLESIARAAATGDAAAQMRAVRRKSFDDLKRNRELAAKGRLIFPVVSEDLFSPGGLDAVMLEAAEAMHEIDGVSLSDIRAALDGTLLTGRRQRLLWALLPWKRGAGCMREHLAYKPWKASSW